MTDRTRNGRRCINTHRIVFHNFDSSSDYAALPAKFIPWILGVQHKGTDWTFAHVVCNKLKGRTSLSDGMLRVTRSGSVGTIYRRSNIFTAKVKIITKTVHKATEQIECQYLPTISYESRVYVEYHFLPIGQRVNQEFFLTVLRHVLEVMWKKRPNVLVNMPGFISTTFPRKWRRRARSFCAKKIQKENSSCSTADLQPLSPWSGIFLQM